MRSSGLISGDRFNRLGSQGSGSKFSWRQAAYGLRWMVARIGCLLLLYGLPGATGNGLLAADNATDDWRGFLQPLWPDTQRADLLHRSSSPAERYVIPLGMLKKINRRLEFEKQLVVRGQVQRMTLEFPEAERVEQLQQQLQTALERGGASIRYGCRARECGSSSDYANDIFADRVLLGSDGEQYLLVAQLQSPRNAYLVAYLIRRGNRRIAVRIDSIDVGQESSDLSLQQLESQHYLRLSGLRFSPQGELLISESADAIEEIGLIIRNRPDWQFGIVGHSEVLGQKGREFALSLELGQQNAEKLLAALRGELVKTASEVRLSAHSVGLLAPRPQGVDQISWLELVWW